MTNAEGGAVLGARDVMAEIVGSEDLAANGATAGAYYEIGGGDSVGGDSVGGDSVGGDSVGGDSVGGDSVGGDSVGGDSVSGDSVEVLEIVARAPSNSAAAAACEAFAVAATSYRRNSPSKGAEAWLREEAGRLENRVAGAEHDLAEFRTQHDLQAVSAADRQTLYSERIAALEVSRADARPPKRRDIDEALATARREALRLEPLALEESRLLRELDVAVEQWGAVRARLTAPETELLGPPPLRVLDGCRAVSCPASA